MTTDRAGPPDIAVLHGDWPRTADHADWTDERPNHVLRSATRSWHDRVETAFAPFDLQTLEGLRQFLSRQAAAHLPLERELDERGMGQILPDWPERRRSDSLLADLQCLGLPVEETSLHADLPTAAHMFGALYVLEGSRLGGRLLQRRIAGSPDALVRSATNYLNHPGATAGWGGFVRALNAISFVGTMRADLLQGAERAFSLYHQAALLVR